MVFIFSMHIFFTVLELHQSTIMFDIKLGLMQILFVFIKSNVFLCGGSRILIEGKKNWRP